MSKVPEYVSLRKFSLWTTHIIVKKFKKQFSVESLRAASFYFKKIFFFLVFMSIRCSYVVASDFKWKNDILAISCNQQNTLTLTFSQYENVAIFGFLFVYFPKSTKLFPYHFRCYALLYLQRQRRHIERSQLDIHMQAQK